MAPKTVEELRCREREAILGKIDNLYGDGWTAGFSSDFDSEAFQKSAITYDVYMKEGTRSGLICQWFWGVCVTAFNSAFLMLFLPMISHDELALMILSSSSPLAEMSTSAKSTKTI
jgi:hypothetical protein